MIDQSFTLCGNLTKSVDMSEEGVVPARARFRIAHNSRRLDAATGEWKDSETLFMDVVCWRAMAQNVGATIGKGDPVVVVGRLRENSWTDGDKVVHRKFEIDADVVAVDLRRGVTTRFQKVNRAAGESEAFQTAPAAADGHQFGADPADESDLVGVGAAPPF